MSELSLSPSSPSSPYPSSSNSLFRSEDMKYVSITMTADASYSTVKQIGKLGKFHIVDLGNAHSKDGNNAAPSKQQLYYKKRIADCIYWEKKLLWFKEQMGKFKVKLHQDPPFKEEKSGVDLLDLLSDRFLLLEKDLTTSLNFLSEVQNHTIEAIEKKNVLVLCQQLSIDIQAEATLLKQSVSQGLGEPLMHSGGMELSERKQSGGADERFRNYLCGTVPQESVSILSRMVYRASRGNALIRFANIEEPIMDPLTGESIKKSVFYIVFVGRHLASRIAKLCPYARATLYELPEKSDIITEQVSSIEKDLTEREEVGRKTNASIVEMLEKINGTPDNCPIINFGIALQHEKSICETMMKAHYYLTMIAIEGWTPQDEIKSLKNAVLLAVEGTGSPPAAVEIDPVAPIRIANDPPTYFKTTKFTSSFQGIVDTYGVPRYKEVNPGLFTVISFPFLFGVMYGDIGHGTLLTLFGLLLILYENKLDALNRKKELNEIFVMAYGGRYLLFIMGLFALYCGVIYNDLFSVQLRVYDSRFAAPDTNSTNIDYSIIDFNGTPYPFGMDPAWANTSNELAFHNSFKMKLAVILGVTHMIFGIILSAVNHIYFKDYVAIFLEFLPRLIFMASIFGYMVFLIIYKWCIIFTDTGKAPSLIQVMIKMFLSPGSVESDMQLYEGQGIVQAILLLVAFLSVPVMLFGKPVAHKYLSKGGHDNHHAAPTNNNNGNINNANNNNNNNPSSPRGLSSRSHFHDVDISSSADNQSNIEDSKIERKSNINILSSSDETSLVNNDNNNDHGSHSFSDEMIHQGIHTIEFVLGAVSNTASYLRLWALSLAHAELSKVFWDKLMMQYGISSGSAIFAMVGFGAWAAATFAVLLCMDTLECFLHALRLHWVEFQNKFYNADGKAFDPFVLDRDDEITA